MTMLLLRASLLAALIVLAVEGSIGPNPNPGRRVKRELDDDDSQDYSHSRSVPYYDASSSMSLRTSYGTPSFGFFPRRHYNHYYPFFSFPFIDFQMPVYVPWYQGPNVCVETKYANDPEEFKSMMDSLPFGEKSFHQSNQESCQGTGEYYVCRGWKDVNGKRKQYMTTYFCCHGFIRDYNGPGCVEVDVKDLMPALRGMGAVRFVELSEQAGMDDYLHAGNFTVFCPTNIAVDDFLKDFDLKKNQAMAHVSRNGGQTNLSEIVSSHITTGFLRLDDFDDEKILKAEKPGALIRINTYYTPHKIVTANCVPITSENNFARNGIIHRIERVLSIPSRTVADIVAADPQFTTLKSLLSRAGLVQILRDLNGNFTLFAPTDSAFASQVTVMEKLYDESQCISSLMKNHILLHVICSSAIPRQAHSINMIGELLTLTWNVDRKLYVDDVQVVVRDIIGTNGVVHIIDGVLIPGQAKSIIQRLEESEIAEFTDLLELAYLKPTFDSMKNVTFFVPDDESIRNTPPRILESILRSREKLKEVLLYHVALPQVESRGMKNNQILRTSLSRHNVRITHYVTYPYLTKQANVQCARILSPDNKICSGVLHVIDRLLLPPKKSIMAALEDMPDFSTLLMLLKRTGLEDRLRNAEDTYTLLAPTDDAFHQMGSDFISEIMRDRAKGTDFLKMHILSGTVCCEQLRNIYDAGRQQTRSIDGSLLNIRVSLKGTIAVGEAKLVECDISTENGVIHMTDGFVHYFKAQSKSNIKKPSL